MDALHMYEQLGLESLSPLGASALFGVALGLTFGITAQRTRFCLRRALTEQNHDQRTAALTVWLCALGAAIACTQLSIYFGWIDFAEHRFHASSIPVVAIAAGGLLFGAGMVLTRGCASRLTVLAGSGNLRAVIVMLIFAISAHATLKGILTPIRTAVSQIQFELPGVIVTALYSPANALLFSAAAALPVLLLVVTRSEIRRQLLGGCLIGCLVAVGWVGTGMVLQDDFDPIAFQSLTFISASTEWLFWSIASTSIGAGFGVGLFSGVVFGSALSALLRAEFQWITFESPAQTGRYLSGGIFMGVGGALAGGCTVGAGLSGASSLSASALLTLGFISLGAFGANAALKSQGRKGAGLNLVTA
ncbi:MAG: YeeE/YedE family protein [Granulosicoccus sp.]